MNGEIWYHVYSQHKKTFEKCPYGTYADECDAQKVKEEMECKCPDEEFFIEEKCE